MSALVSRKAASNHSSVGWQKGYRHVQIPDWTWAAAASFLVACISFVPKLYSATFYYWDDMMQSFLPVWRHMGDEILAGRFPLMDPGGWVGGNIVAEVGYGIFNPVNIINAIVVSQMDDLALASYFIVIQFMALIAFGTFMLCRQYGGNVPLSFAASVAMPFSGFTLFYEAARWPGGLMAFAWTTLFWWATRRYAHRCTSPFPPFLVGFMTMTAGNPYGAIGIIIVLLAVAVELAAVRNWRRIAPLTVLGAAVGLTAVLVYFPLPLSAAVTVRTSSLIVNDLFLQPDMSSLVASSTANYLPRLNNFWGPIESVPSSYLAWFTMPLLPWLNFRAIRSRTRHISSLYIITGIYFLLTFAPSNVLLFRWPLRLIEYFFLGVIVLVVTVGSAGLRTTAWKSRLLLSIGIVLFGSYRAWSMVPEGNKAHAIALFLALALIAASVLAYRRYGMPGIAAMMVVGTVATLGLQARLYVPHSPIKALGSPTNARELEAAAQPLKGNTLQVFNFSELEPEEFTSGRILYGNQILNAGVENSLGRYSGISFLAFADALCMNYRAETCPEAFHRIFAPAAGNTSVTLADLMRIETVSVQKDLIPEEQLQSPPGWSIISDDSSRTIFQRDTSFAHPGTVSYVSDGVTVESAEANDYRETVVLGNSAPEGSIIFSRLAWPGYEVHVDGVSQTLRQGPAGLIEVRFPAGTKLVELDYRTPGIDAGMASQALAWFSIGAMTLHHYASRLPRGHAHQQRRKLGSSA